jgi:transcriptional regulator with XRE-family HTH domain
MEGSRARTALGRAVRVYRGRLAISQEELGFRCALHRTYIGGIERGERNPTYEKLLQLADGLDVAAWELLRRADPSG